MSKNSSACAATAVWLLIAAAIVAVPSPAAAADTLRFDGSNRYDTAAGVSEELDQCQVVVANGETFPDGLAGALFGLPILLTRATSLPAETVAELDRLDAQCSGLERIIVLGGTAAVSDAVFDQIGAYAPIVFRLGGASRYETALEVARAFDELSGLPQFMFLATGENFADALAAGPVAAERGFPIILNDGDSLRPDVAQFIQDQGIQKIWILGGPAAVPETIDEEIATDLGIDVERLAGVDRFDTAAKLALEFFLPSCGLIVNGTSFADALAAGPLGGRGECPTFLVTRDDLPPATAAALTAFELFIDTVIAVGGEGVVSDATLAAAAAAAD